MGRNHIGKRIALSVAVACLSVPQFAIAQPAVDVGAPRSVEADELAGDAGGSVVGSGAYAKYPAALIVATGPAPVCNCGGTGVCCDETRKKAVAAKVRDSYKAVFYANDYSYLNDPCYDGCLLGDGLKQLSMPHQGELDLGGEVRVRYHSEENMRGLGLTGRDDQFWLTRLRLFANYRVNEWLRAYGEFIYADSGGEFFNNRNIEENRGDAQNLFVDATLLDDGGSSLVGRVGRQELIYGNQRLISPLDWANTRRTFDGYKLMYSGAKWDIDGFFVNPLNRLLTTEDSWDSANDDTDFYGVYSTRKGLAIGTLDFYYLGLDYQAAGASYHTLGSRLAGNRGSWLYEMERGVQFGDDASESDHTAFFYTVGLGRKLDLCVRGKSWKPTVWAWYDYASGEDSVAEGGRFGDGFDHLFPLGHKYLGFMDLFGRRNIQDLNAQFITPVMGERVSLLVWYHYFLLDELTTPYNVDLTPFNTTTAAADHELGHEIDVLFNIAISPRNSALVGYSYFDTGNYYDQTSGGVAGNNGIPTLDDAQFFYAQYQMQF